MCVRDGRVSECDAWTRRRTMLRAISMLQLAKSELDRCARVRVCVVACDVEMDTLIVVRAALTLPLDDARRVGHGRAT